MEPVEDPADETPRAPSRDRRRVRWVFSGVAVALLAATVIAMRPAGDDPVDDQGPDIANQTDANQTDANETDANETDANETDADPPVAPDVTPTNPVVIQTDPRVDEPCAAGAGSGSSGGESVVEPDDEELLPPDTRPAGLRDLFLGVDEVICVMYLAAEG